MTRLPCFDSAIRAILEIAVLFMVKPNVVANDSIIFLLSISLSVICARVFLPPPPLLFASCASAAPS